MKLTMTIACVLFAASIFSQEVESVRYENIKGRYNVKASFQSTFVSSNDVKKTANNASIELNYGVLKFLEAGVYLKKTSFDALFYGANVNIHILPFVKEKSNFDLYATSKYGLGNIEYVEINDTNASNKKENISEFSAGIGASYYFWKNFGVNVECLYQTFSGDNKYGAVRYGVAYRF